MDRKTVASFDRRLAYPRLIPLHLEVDIPFMGTWCQLLWNRPWSDMFFEFLRYHLCLLSLPHTTCSNVRSAIYTCPIIQCKPDSHLRHALYNCFACTFYITKPETDNDSCKGRPYVPTNVHERRRKRQVVCERKPSPQRNSAGRCGTEELHARRNAKDDVFGKCHLQEESAQWLRNSAILAIPRL